MSNKNLTILGIIAAVMIVLTVLQSQYSKMSAKPPTTAPANLIQGLDPSLIAAVTIQSSDNTVNLSRNGNSFVAPEKDGYPVKTKQINDLITKVLDIKTREMVTDSPANHPDLEVTEEKAQTVVKFSDNAGNIITGVIIGKRTEKGDNFVRLTSSDNVYLAGGAPYLNSSTISYLEQQITDVDTDGIITVSVTDPNTNYKLVSKTGSDAITFENLPTGKKLKEAEAKNVFSALDNLTFEDVSKTPPQGLDFNHKYICTLENSTVYTVLLAQKDDKTFLKCSAEFTDERPAEINKSESEEELKAKEAKLLADDAVQSFNAAHTGWIYQISENKANNLIMRPEELLEDEKEEEPPADENSEG